MHAIFIRGRKEPVTCDDRLGRSIKEKWVDGGDAMMEIEDATFPMKAIYRIEANWKPSREDSMASNNEEKMRENMEERSEERRKYENYIKSIRLQPIERRAKNLNIANLIWYGSTGTKEMPQELRDQIIERQVAYFKENPDDAYANPICYQDLMRIQDESYKDVVPPARYHIRNHAFNFAERVLQSSYVVK